MKLEILGTEYTVEVKQYHEDKHFYDNGWGGYCGFFDNCIVLCDLHTHPEYADESEKSITNAQKQCLRHEIVHAFLKESGLCDSANSCECWAINEEMVDWFAAKGKQIYSAWEAAGAL